MEKNHVYTAFWKDVYLMVVKLLQESLLISLQIPVLLSVIKMIGI